MTPTIRILDLAANPIGTQQLHLAQEVREIETRIRASRHPDSIELIPHWAVQYGDLEQALLECKPTVLHFSGHGSPRGEILLQDASNRPRPLNTEALETLLGCCGTTFASWCSMLAAHNRRPKRSRTWSDARSA